MKKSNENISLDEMKVVHGVQIKKMPCGKYFSAMQTLKDLPEDFIKEITNDNKDMQLSELLDLKNIIILVNKLFLVAPNFIFNFLSSLLDIDRDVIENELSPSDLIDIIEEFWKINKLENFFQKMKSAINQMKDMKTGFKE